MRTAVLTISTRVSREQAQDESGPLLARLADANGCDIEAIEVIADDRELIEQRLRHYVDAGADLILTTGGTGLAPDDVTPEATAAVVNRPVPGIAEAMRAESLRHTPHGMLSRELAGTAGGTLIVNFPGSPRAIEQLFAVVAPALEHAVKVIGGDSRH